MKSAKYLLLTLFVLLTFTGCKEAETTAVSVNKRAVMVYEVTSDNGYVARNFPGVSSSARTVNLSFRVGGPIVELNVKVGDYVKEGDILAKIDPRDYQIAVEQFDLAIEEVNANLAMMKEGAREEDIKVIEAQLEAAEANLEKVRLDFERISQLYKDKIVTKSDFDAISAGYKAAKAQINVYKQQLIKAKTGGRPEEIAALSAKIKQLKLQKQSAENALADTVLIAPFSGFIARKMVEKFQSIGKDATVLTLQDRKNLEVVISVPELEFANLGNVEKREFSVSFQAVPDKTFSAKVKEVSYIAETYTSSFSITLICDVDNARGVFPGMTAEVKLVTSGSSPSRILVPINSIVRDPVGKTYVWVKKVNADNAEKVEVSVGEVSGCMIQVLSGLSVGDRVVSNGAEFVSADMQLVEIQ